MQERIDAFYRQSGGPNNPNIKRFLDKHLMYGKDHGMPGRKETLENAFIDMVVGDPSMLILFQRLMRLRQTNPTPEINRDRATEDVIGLKQDIANLRTEVKELRQLLEQALYH
ncbi:hypothetical protein JZ786_15920 [Alicyclobacillus mengziensis]|uniref:Uncharacterized protein n=2 Tax=Alicyclobacillus mengziensis TaxID=2931921 RepID=A0A9X7Z8R6_9BACL|nr:hypothetical protein JZ786_15920 [Alicyclobacillus mengziensis]